MIYCEPDMRSQRPASISLILPVLNGEDRLVDVLEEVRSTLASLNPEVVVVYDVTRPELLDEVEAEQRELEKRYLIRSLTRLNERGFGSALRAGFQASSGHVIIPVMADCSDDLAAIPQMLSEIEAGADVVAGSRYMPGGGVIGDTIKQRLSRLYSKIVQVISGLPCRDVSNSFKAYRRQVWEDIASEATSFDFSAEMTIKAAVQGYRVTEVPAVWTNRQAGRSNFRMLGEFPNYVRWLPYAARHLRPRLLLVAAALGLVSLLLLAPTMWAFARGRRRRSAG